MKSLPVVPGAGTTIVIPSSVVEEIAKQSSSETHAVQVGTTLVVPSAIVERIQSQTLDTKGNLWQIAEQKMKAFTKDKRYGTISLIYQEGKLIQVEARESHRA